VLKVRNVSGRPRRLSATGYAEWVLGDLRHKSSMHVVSEIDPATGALLARNHYNREFADKVVFFHVDDVTRTLSGDRTEFIGRNGTLRNPAALSRARLSGRVGSAMDPCAAIQVPFELAEGQSREIIFRMGVGRGAEGAAQLAKRLSKSGTARAELEAVRDHWSSTLGAIQVETPDAALNLLCNGWLVYQTMACRLWGRSGFYQSGGAFGFRDQLQDVMALVHSDPRRVRDHILLCASRQFLEGDVQHWWHPPSGRGVRTNCSDDFLWLPLAVCRYVFCTGDSAILIEPVPFLDGRAVSAEEDSYYDLPLQSGETATLYEHCVRAIQRGLRFGAHGLPLMGAGDWNDGMNRVGEAGKGESVWLGWFLHAALTAFIPIAAARKETARVQTWKVHADALSVSLDAAAWDGEWYRRGYYDDGTPLGSSSSDECRIDSIAQSWAALSGAGDPARAIQAMASLDRQLVHRGDRLVLLFTPPFDKTPLDPGYIKGYPPGIRENGGQYTHGAVWAVMGFAALGQGDKAAELFSMLNPITHTATRAGVLRYKVEPYVSAADVYSVPPHAGRGGWTWYTGSAGWLYRAGVESILGLRVQAESLVIDPCIPAAWPEFSMTLRYRGAVYEIAVHNPENVSRGVVAVELDGTAQAVPDGKARVNLCQDRGVHAILVTLGPAASG
jgi:cyclic beta-1,2-glucan synthetase